MNPTFVNHPRLAGRWQWHCLRCDAYSAGHFESTTTAATDWAMHDCVWDQQDADLAWESVRDAELEQKGAQ